MGHGNPPGGKEYKKTDMRIRDTVVLSQEFLKILS